MKTPVLVLLAFATLLSAGWSQQPDPAQSNNEAPAPGARVTIATIDKIRVIALKAKQPRLYDSNPLRTIGGVSPKLAGLEFTSIPQRLTVTYDIEVEEPGMIYCFGAPATSPAEAFGADAARWKPEEDVLIHGLPKVVCYQRTVARGEKIHVAGFELSIAAKEIKKRQ